MTNQSLKEAFQAMWKNILHVLDLIKTDIHSHTSNTDNPHKVTIYDIGAAASSHTHNYAGSSSAGGAANSANKLNTNAGSATNPVYFSNGIPVKTTYTLGASVPSGAKFTDTTYSNATTSAAGLMSATDKTNLDGLVTKVGDTAVSTQINNAIDEITPASIGAAASSHTHSGYASSSHTHNYAGSSSAGGAANSVAKSMTVQLNSGTTEGTDKFTFNGSAAKSVNITPSAIGAAASSHGTHVSYSSTAPVMDGTASVGSASTVARSDHKHPTDTTRAAASDLTSHTGNTSNPHKVTAAQVGADPSGSANSALESAKSYTDSEISEWVGDKTVSNQISTAVANTVKTSGDQTIAGNKTFTGLIQFSDSEASITPAIYTDYTDTLKMSVGDRLYWMDSDGHFQSSIDGRFIGENTLSNYGVTGIKGNAESSYRKGDVNITTSNLGLTATPTELNYCDGVTSNIQTQLDSKLKYEDVVGTSIPDPLGIAYGGTGATTIAGARNALGLGNTSGALPIANGGTGATTEIGAINNLGIADYIIEEGTSGNWTYRKWSNGEAECWYHANYGKITLSTALGTDIVSAGFRFPFPFEFTEIPTCIVCYEGNSTGYAEMQAVGSGGVATTTQSAMYRLVRIGSATIALNDNYFSVYVKGKVS